MKFEKIEKQEITSALKLKAYLDAASAFEEFKDDEEFWDIPMHLPVDNSPRTIDLIKTYEKEVN